MEKKEKRIVSHIVSLVLGIISIFTVLFYYISLPTGITAIVLGINSYKKYNKKMGIAGFITGIVGVAICALFYISMILLLLLYSY